MQNCHPVFGYALASAQTCPPRLTSFRIRVVYFPGIPSSSGLIIQDRAGRSRVEEGRTEKRVPNWQSGNTRFSELVSNVRPHAYWGLSVNDGNVDSVPELLYYFLDPIHYWAERE